MTANFKKPRAIGEEKPYRRYIEDLHAWTYITKKEKKKKTGACTIALSSPENDKSQIRDKVFNEINLEDLKLIMVLKH